MMPKVKTLPVLLATLLLGLVLAVSLLVPPTETDSLTFKAGTGQRAPYFATYLDDSTGCHYLFLPGYVDLDSLTLETPSIRLSLGGKVFKKGDRLPALDTGRVYDITLSGRGGQHRGTLAMRQLAEVATMFIDINPATLEKVNQSKSVMGMASMTLMASDGSLLFDGSESPIRLKGHGSSTFRPSKKAYKIQLEHPAALLGMAPATQWILLANAFDETNLKNKMVQDYAKTLDYCWTPNCKYVDLYINQTYHGLYLLSEKVEVGETRFHGDTDSLHLFVIDYEGLIRLCSPKELYFSLVSPNPYGIYLYEEELRRFCDAVYHPDADPQHPLEETIDIHSWSCRYLIDEVFANQDLWCKSNYFYCCGEPPYVFYAGPAWDYDLIGRYPTNHFTGLYNAPSIPYYGFMDNDTFRTHTLQLYTTHCRPYVEWLIDEGIDSMAASIQLSTRANSIRWRALFNEKRFKVGWLQPTMPSPDSLKSFLQQHTAFLDRHWLRNIPYQKIFIDMKQMSADFWIEYQPGATVSQYIQQVPNTEEYNTYVWQDSLTGKIYYPNTIVEDSNVYLKLCDECGEGDEGAVQNEEPPRKKSKKVILRYGIVALFGILGIMVMGCNVREGERVKKVKKVKKVKREERS